MACNNMPKVGCMIGGKYVIDLNKLLPDDWCKLARRKILFEYP